jgi:hypothetical protein
MGNGSLPPVTDVPIQDYGTLKDQFAPDLDPVFFNPDEFGERNIEPHVNPLSGAAVRGAGRQFAIIGPDGAEKVFIAKCVWDKSEVQRRMIVQQQGVYIGDVMLFIAKSWFAVQPRPEEILYTWDQGNPNRSRYRIIQVVDAEECYEMSLDKLT